MEGRRPRGSACSWRKAGGPASIERTPSGLSLLRYRIPLPEARKARGRRLLFISDLHIRAEATFSLSASHPGCLLSWHGLDWVAKALHEAVSISRPDVLVFGGDLVVHSCWLERAMDMMASLAPGVPKLAVMGNWDKRRRRWLPNRVWQDAYAKAGFALAVNSGFTAAGMRLYGLDDFKMGQPRYESPSPELGLEWLNCVVSHNPDAVVEAMTDDELSAVDLVLCGHTHGGQWRLPLFGALKTSSEHWKRFELGLYRHSRGSARMLISGGVGATFLRLRANCPPEAALVEFV